jgi:hypothetical protein
MLKEINKTTLNKMQASDQWSYGEAKFIQQNLCEATNRARNVKGGLVLASEPRRTNDPRSIPDLLFSSRAKIRWKW